MVYRIVIVDDESYIADTTAMRLQGDFSEETEMNVFYAPEDALAFARQYRVDILITDIRMPGMNGLELVRRVSDYWPMCQVILLSAYAEFDYLYEAQKDGQVAYVLKQDGYDALLETVRRAFAQLESVQLREEQMSATRRQALITQTLLARECLTELLNGAIDREEQLLPVLRQLELPVDLTKPAVLSLGLMQKPAGDQTMPDRLEGVGRIARIARSCMPANAGVLIVPIDERRFLWLMQLDRSDWRLRPEEILEAVQSQLAVREGVGMSFLYCPDPVPWQRYPSLYLRMTQAVLRKPAIEATWIEEVPAVADAPRAEMEERAMLCLSRWKRARRMGAAQAHEAFAKLVQLLAETPSVQDPVYMWLYGQIAVELAGQFLQPDDPEAKATTEKLYAPTAHASPREGAQFLAQVDAWLTQTEARRHSETVRSITSQVREYILSHLADDVSLTMLSQQVCVSPSYLSRLFKQETGSNIKDYITSARIEAACALLKNADEKIYDISEKLGFQTPSYFSFFFRKCTGMTPKEYRETLLKPGKEVKERSRI